MSVGLEITKDTATPALRGVGPVMLSRFMAEMGPRMTRLMQRNFRKQGLNKKGWPSTHFWARAAEATNWQLEGEGLEMSIVVGTDQIGVRQRYLGGEIKPVNAQALTIPISPVSYGRTSRDFPGAFVLWTKKGAYIVQHGESVGGDGTVSATTARKLGGNFKRRQKASLNFLFKLAKGVRQDADPGVVPTDEEFAEEMDKSMEAIAE
jgi:hypothetical protein